MVDEDACNQGHVLGIGSDGKFSMGTICDLPRKEEVKLHILFPVDSEMIGEERNLGRSSSMNTDHDEKDCDASREVCGEERLHAKKKLRLTTEQATLLQNSFEKHRTLNYEQKQELADQLNLQPKQVEIWFQNRRARTKLKRTEMDCEYLNKYCQSLREENQRLKEELMELRTLKRHGSAPFLIHRLQRVPTDTCNMCLSCQETSTLRFGRNNSNTFAKAS